MVELEIENTTVEQVATAISEALHTPTPETVLSYSRLPSGAVRVVAGSPVSPRQREAIASLRERRPDARVEETGPLTLERVGTDLEHVGAACTQGVERGRSSASGHVGVGGQFGDGR